MPLPKRNPLPSLDSLVEQEEIKELTEADFQSPEAPSGNNYYDELPQEQPSEDFVDYSEPVNDENTVTPFYPEEEPQETITTTKEDKKAKKKKQKQLRGGKKKKSLIISFVVSFLIIAIVGAGIFFYMTYFNSSKETSKTQPETPVTVEYSKEEYGGIVFNITAKEDAFVNVQRLYTQEDGTIVLCETGEIEVFEGEQEGFLECLNATEDVKNTSDKKIQDNVIIKK